MGVHKFIIMALLENLILQSASPLIGGITGIFGAKSNQSYNEEMWHKNNEYNSMKSQVQRAIEAGINPNALFGNGMSAAQSNPLSVTPETNSVAQASNLMSIVANNALLVSQINKNDTESDLNKYTLTWNKLTEEERYKQLINMNSESKSRIAKIFSDIGVNDFNKDMQERTFRWFARKTDAEIKIMNEQLNVLRNQSLDILKGIDVKDAQIRDLLSSSKLKEKQLDVADADISLKSAQTEHIQSQTRGQNIDNDIQSVIKQWSDITGIPLGANDTQAMFALWKEGKFEDVANIMHINDANNTGGSKLGEARKSATRLLMGLQQLLGDPNP